MIGRSSNRNSMHLLTTIIYITFVFICILSTVDGNSKSRDLGNAHRNDSFQDIFKLRSEHHSRDNHIHVKYKRQVKELKEQESMGEENVNDHKSWKLLEDPEVECGESSGNRIIGGKDADLGQFPWIARLGYLVTSLLTMRKEITKDYVTFSCGGTLINKNYVLTAAHCVKTPGMSLVKVRLGEYNIKDEVDCIPEMCANEVQDIAPSKIITHKSYDKPAFSNDIALIRLEHPPDFNGWVVPICLHKAHIYYPPESVAEVAGWGVTNITTEATASILQTLNVALAVPDSCVQLYRQMVRLSSEQICAGGTVDEDACGGDSGGPLMKVDDVGGFPQYYLIGVVAFGPSLCGGTTPGIYTNVSYHLKWILDSIEP